MLSLSLHQSPPSQVNFNKVVHQSTEPQFRKIIRGQGSPSLPNAGTSDNSDPRRSDERPPPEEAWQVSNAAGSCN